MAQATKDGVVALDVRSLTKTYPGVRALKGVDLTVRRGEVHGIVGENGAGKSTLMKSIAGALEFDSGSVQINGTLIAGGDPKRAAEAGLAMIYQELAIVPHISAQSNVFLGRLPRRGVLVDRARLRAQYDAVAARVGSTVPPTAPAGGLSTADQQLLEIMRALASDRRIIIMDEPTASLGPADIERLHRIIDDLRAAGHAIVYVSHDLDAVLDICDRVTVLRDGALAATGPASEWTTAGLVTAMLGGVSLVDQTVDRADSRIGDELLAIEDLTGPGVDLPLLRVHAGEVIGLAGLVGSGRTRLLRALCGAGPVVSGAMTVRGRAVPWPGHPRAAWRNGIALAPEDRKLQGLLLHQAAAWNVALGWFRRAAQGGPVRLRRLVRWAQASSRQVGFDTDRLTFPASALSGGNQQKLMLARLIARPVDVILLDEPTRGIDVGAKAQVFATMRDLASNGRSIIWSSSEIDEVMEHSDRILVVSGGRVVSELPRGATVHDVLEATFLKTTRNDRVSESKGRQ